MSSYGELEIIPAGVVTAWEQDTASTSVVIQLSPSLLHRAAEESGLNPDLIELTPQCGFRDPQLEHIIWALDAERRDDHQNGSLFIESLGLSLALRLVGRHTASARSFGRELSRVELRRVVDFIEDHLDQDLSLTRLAEVAAVSVSHLKALFRPSMGLPVHEYVMQRRVERAKSLLLRGDLPAVQVAIEAGFSHQSHMAKWMKRILGITPSSVARQSRRD